MRTRPVGRGFSLIELLVSMAIGLIVTLAITSIMVNGESKKRSSTAVNDVNQSGGYAAYVLDRQIRSAGSGYARRFQDIVGCTLYAHNGNGQVLPKTAAYTASSPFTSWSTPAASAVAVRVAPVIVGYNYANKGTTGTDVRGDVLMVMSGTGGFTEVPQQVQATVLPTSVLIPNTVGYRVGDLVMLADASVGAPPRCMIEEISAVDATGQKLTFGGGYNRQVIGGIADVGDYNNNSFLAQLGNSNSNLPQFSLMGVGDNATLYSNDLLPAGLPDDIGQPIADSVVEMRALYGVVPYPTATVPIVWTSPGAVGYTASTISSATLRKIVAIRVGLILRTSLLERASDAAYSGPTSIQLFAGADVPAAARPPARNLAGDDLRYRYRTVEVTIPLPNVVTAP